jgi:surfactin synthase thioesterase subunit
MECVASASAAVVLAGKGESPMRDPVEFSSRWFLSCGIHAAARVFCFAHAGGNPRLFLNWQSAMGTEAQIVAVCPPGRGPRADEPSPATLAALADEAAEAICALGDAPTYLFGHSLGALVAFEVARRLPAPRDLVVSGLAAPSLMPTRQAVAIAQLDGRAFVEAVASYGGLPRELLAVEDAYHLLLPGLQADFRLIQSYRYTVGPLLAAGLTIINGRDDPNVSTAVLAPWAQEFSSPPRYHWVDGGHFFFESQPDAIIEIMRRLVRSDLQHAELI